MSHQREHSAPVVSTLEHIGKRELSRSVSSPYMITPKDRERATSSGAASPKRELSRSFSTIANLTNITAELATATQIKSSYQEKLVDVNNKLDCLDEIKSGLLTQINSHFDALTHALEARRSALLQEVDSHVSVLQVSLDDAHTKLTAGVQFCSQTISSATQIHKLMPDLAVSSLQALKSLSSSTITVPTVTAIFSEHLLPDINKEGQILMGKLNTITTSLQNPEHLTFNPKDGCCYSAGGSSNKIYKVAPTGDVTDFAGTGEAGWEDGDAKTAKFNYPSGITCDHATGDIYVGDTNNNIIRKITLDGSVSTLAGNGMAAAVDGMSMSASFKYPCGLDMTQSDGCIYVADYSNHKVRKITPEGFVYTVAGTTCGFSDGAVDAACFNNPIGISVNPNTGEIFVADSGNHRIRKITSEGVFTVAGNGTPAYLDGAGLDTAFSTPYNIKVDPRTDCVYIADFGNHAVRKIAPTGMVSTVKWLLGDGKTVSSEIKYPRGISFDETQHHVCYVSSYNPNKVIQIFVP